MPINLKLLPNFFGKTIGEVMNYCNSNGLKCNSDFKLNTDVVITQSVHANTDVSTIGNKEIVFEVESLKNNYNEEEIKDNKDTVVDNGDKDENKDSEIEEPQIPPLDGPKEEGEGDLIEDKNE